MKYILFILISQFAICGLKAQTVTQPGLRDYQISGGALYDSILYIMGTDTVGTKRGLGKWYRGDSLVNGLGDHDFYGLNTGRSPFAGEDSIETALDTMYILFKGLSGALATKIEILKNGVLQFDNEAGLGDKYLIKIKPLQTGEGNHNFNIVQTTAANISGARNNDVVQMGFNFGSAGVEQSGTGAFGFSFEDHYRPAAATAYNELHLVATDSAGTAYRPWTWLLDKGTKDTWANASYINQFYLREPSTGSEGHYFIAARENDNQSYFRLLGSGGSVGGNQDGVQHYLNITNNEYIIQPYGDMPSTSLIYTNGFGATYTSRLGIQTDWGTFLGSSGQATSIIGREASYGGVVDVDSGWGWDLVSGALVIDSSQVATQYDLTLISGGTTDLTIGGAGPTYTIESSTGTDVTVSAGTGISLSESPANTLVITNSVTDTDDQDITVTGASQPFTIDLDADATDMTFTGAGITTVSRSGNALTWTSTEVDASTSNETNTIEEDNSSEQTGNLTLDFQRYIDSDADGGTEVNVSLDMSEAQIDGGVEGDEYFLIHDPDTAASAAIQRYRIVDLTNEIVSFEEDNSNEGSGNTFDFGTGIDGAFAGTEYDVTLDFNEFTTDAATEGDEFVIISDGAGVIEKVAISSFGGADGNGIYTGDGTVPTDVDAAVTDSLEFNGTLKIINDANDRVGIGAQSPEAKLHVRNLAAGTDNEMMIEATGEKVEFVSKSVSDGVQAPFTLTVMNKDLAVDLSGDYYQMGNITFSKASASTGGGAINFNVGYDSTNVDGILTLKSRESGATDGLVNVAGGLRFKWRTDATAAATFNTGDYGITMTAAGAKTATVPDATSTLVGQTFFIFNSGTSGDITVQITGGSGDTIYGDTTVAINESVTITCPETGVWISN